MQIAGYLRLLSQGVSLGNEASAARNAADESELGRERQLRLLNTTTRHQAMFFAPLALLLAFLAEPIVRIWIGSRLEDAAAGVPTIATVLRILLIGLTARALTQGWVQVLNGAARLGSYGRLVMLGSVGNAVIVGVSAWWVPHAYTVYFVAAVYSALHVCVHTGLVPVVVARVFAGSAAGLLMPAIRPIAVALACTPCLLAAGVTGQASIAGVAGATLLYGLAYGAIAYRLVLAPREREAFRVLLTRKPARRATPAPAVRAVHPPVHEARKTA